MAKLAGLPESVINKAKGYLKDLEAGKAEMPVPVMPTEDQISLTDVGGSEIAEELLRIDLDTVTPIEAMNLLYQLQKKAKG